ncbi:DnaB-like helicase N-terminal domain-containing protein [Streptomyces sp. NPDC048172]|uniref:DnaB-like helicase N-terminal domain-containing protein n=1 Tax=Streptomyces sp. NPDC048172 TaxID=3365505 RepID=UPI003714CE66
MSESPLMQAEQAVLGAVLLEPRQLGRLAGWLRPEHFYRPAHAALYTAMLDLRAQGHPATRAPAGEPVPISWVNGVQEGAGARTRGVTAAYVHSLASACPRPAHAPVYGRMVLEGAIHRSVAEHAHRLHQAAREDAARGAGVAATLHHAQVLADVLDDLGRRWGTEPRPAHAPTPQAAPRSVQVSADERVRDAEEFLLGVLATHPHQMREVVGWLRPEDFSDPGHEHLYRALGGLHHRGEPIDALTVLWECQRRGTLADCTLDAERVRHLCASAAGGSADYFAEQILDASLLRTATASARHIRDLADDKALAPGPLIHQATAALVPLNEVRRWRAAAAEGEPDTAATKPSGAPPEARAAAARVRTTAPSAGTKPASSASMPARTLRSVRPHRSPS